MYEDLPMILRPKEVSEVLKISLDITYRLFQSKSFPSEKINGKYIIPKPRFINWLGHSSEGADFNAPKTAS